MNIIYKSNRFIIFYLIMLLAIMAYYFKPDSDLDLYLYYKEVPFLASKPILEYIVDCVNDYSDFMYRSLLIIIYNIGFPVEIVTAFFVGSYFYLIYKILTEYLRIRKIKLSRQDELIVFIASFFSVLPIFVFSISRMLAGIVVFYWGLLFLIRQRYVFGLFLVFFSLTFHLGMVLFLFILFISWCINKIDINSYISNRTFRFLFFFLAGVSPLFFFYLFFPRILSYVYDLGLFGDRYQDTYLSNEEVASVFNNKMWFVRYGEPFNLLIMFLLLVNAHQREEVNYGLSFLFFYSVFLGSICFLGDRMMMMMPILYGILMTNVIYERKIKHKKASFFMLLIFVFTFFNIFNFYTCRPVFFGIN